MKPFEIKPDIYWIGALHPDLRVFDIIMRTKNGTTYNSYLIKDESVAIVDTVKAKYSNQYLDHIASLVDPAAIKYVIIQHTEPDHSECLGPLLEFAPEARVVCARTAAKYVGNILNREVNPILAENNSTINLGKRTLRFFSTPFLHWPDTMMTFVEEEKLLFPCDVFSSHFCDSRMFNDVITRDFWPDFKYYFDMIIRPYKKHMRNALKKITPLEIEMLAPSHGPILRTEIEKYMRAYEEWSAPATVNEPKKVIIYYASAHGNTQKMAEKIVEGLESKGVYVQVFDAMTVNVMEHLDRIEEADALVLGSPTINNDVVKPIWDVLNSLTTIDVKGKVGACFGSIGWSGESVKLLEERMNAMKFKLPLPAITSELVPSEDDLQKCFDFGVQLAEELG